MQVQEIDFPCQIKIINQQPIVLAAGFFDGIHLGHQNVIKTAVRLAHNKHLPCGVMTFDRHPATVFGTIPPEKYQYLSLLPRKLELLEQIGVDIVYIVKFDQQFSQLQPVEFVNEFLLKFKLNTLVAGFDWTFGPADRADMQHLKTLAKNHFAVVEVPQLQMAGAKISSTNVRKALKTHQIFQANLMLNYNYQNSGQVVHGRAVGRTLGFPTANLAVHPQQLVPDFGVYVTRVQINNQWYPAMTQIGRNLTFNQGQNPVTIEANILDFEQDIYGKTMKLEWLQYLRGEIAFDNPQQLVRQLKQDQEATKNYFAKK